MNNIFRIDTGNTHGWQVRIQRNNRLYSRFFADSKFSSSADGRRAAESYRDEMIGKLGAADPAVSHLHTAEAKRKAWEAVSRTGIEGLGVTWQTETGGAKYPYVQAHWVGDDGRRRASKRSIEKHGVQSATRHVCDLLVRHHHGYDDVEALYRKAIRRVNRLLREGPGPA